MSVHYKFKNSVDYDTVNFDGVHISVGDLKKAIIQQKKLGKSDCDYKITDAETKVVYGTDETLIPKNSSVIVCRVPLIEKKKSNWNRGKDANGIDANPATNDTSVHVSVSKITKASDRTKTTKGEDELIKDMIAESTEEYDSSHFARGDRRGPPGGPLPSNYVCYRCNQTGHHIKQCPTNNLVMKRSTGIPRSFMVPCDPTEKGAYMTPDGGYARSVVEAQAYSEVKIEKPPTMASFDAKAASEPAKPEIPPELTCPLCSFILHDAVLISCCAEATCDECIRNVLIQSEEHECPLCHTKNVLPDTLIPCIKLRKEVTQFLAQTDPLRKMTLGKENTSINTNAASSNNQVTSVNQASSVVQTTSVNQATPVNHDSNSKQESPRLETNNSNRDQPSVNPASSTIHDSTKTTDDNKGDSSVVPSKPEPVTGSTNSSNSASSVSPADTASSTIAVSTVSSANSVINVSTSVNVTSKIGSNGGNGGGQLSQPPPPPHKRGPHVPHPLPLPLPLPPYFNNNNSGHHGHGNFGGPMPFGNNNGDGGSWNAPYPDRGNHGHGHGPHPGESAMNYPGHPPRSLPSGRRGGHMPPGPSHFPPSHFGPRGHNSGSLLGMPPDVPPPPPPPQSNGYIDGPYGSTSSHHRSNHSAVPFAPYSNSHSSHYQQSNVLYNNNFSSGLTTPTTTGGPSGVTLPESTTYGHITSLPYDQAVEAFQRALEHRSRSPVRDRMCPSDGPSIIRSSGSRSLASGGGHSKKSESRKKQSLRRSRSRSRSRDRSDDKSKKDKDKDRSEKRTSKKSPTKDKEREKEKEKEKSKEKDKDKEKEKERDKEKKDEKSKNRSKDKNKDRKDDADNGERRKEDKTDARKDEKRKRRKDERSKEERDERKDERKDAKRKKRR